MTPTFERSLLRRVLAVATLLVLAGAVARADEPSLDADGLGKSPFGRMYLLLEKTFLNIDVLTIEIRFASDTADALRALAEGQKPSSELTERIATRAYRADDAYVEIVFKRNVGMDEFVDGARKNLDRARRANMLDEESFQNISRNLPRLFAFLGEEGIKSGDRLVYRIRPTSMRSLYVDKGGKVRLDQTDKGTGPRVALLGSYFAPGSDFRNGLVASLFHQ